MVFGFICESFGYIPEEGAKIVVLLERANQEENSENTDTGFNNHDEKENHQTFELEVLEANEKMVGKAHFKPINNGSPDVETKDLNRFLSTKVVKRKKQREMESGSNSVQIKKRVEEGKYLDDRSYHDRLEGYGTVEKGDGYDSNSQP